jgi:hypothetical protein
MDSLVHKGGFCTAKWSGRHSTRCMSGKCWVFGAGYVWSRQACQGPFIALHGKVGFALQKGPGFCSNPVHDV